MVQHLSHEHTDQLSIGATTKAGAPAAPVTVAKLSQKPIALTCFGICFERKRIPRLVEILRKSLNAKETREADLLRPRQVRYQTALRPDSTDYTRPPYTPDAGLSTSPRG
jgi:hypothetical protein